MPKTIVQGRKPKNEFVYLKKFAQPCAVELRESDVVGEFNDYKIFEYHDNYYLLLKDVMSKEFGYSKDFPSIKSGYFRGLYYPKVLRANYCCPGGKRASGHFFVAVDKSSFDRLGRNGLSRLSNVDLLDPLFDYMSKLSKSFVSNMAKPKATTPGSNAKNTGRNEVAVKLDKRFKTAKNIKKVKDFTSKKYGLDVYKFAITLENNQSFNLGYYIKRKDIRALNGKDPDIRILEQYNNQHIKLQELDYIRFSQDAYYSVELLERCQTIHGWHFNVADVVADIRNKDSDTSVEILNRNDLLTELKNNYGQNVTECNIIGILDHICSNIKVKLPQAESKLDIAFKEFYRDMQEINKAVCQGHIDRIPEFSTVCNTFKEYFDCTE